MRFKIIKISFFILAITVLSLLGLFGYYFNSADAQGVEYSIAGWVWSENFGWISLNSQNCELLPTGACTVPNLTPYGVTINSSNEIAGYGWSENVGWVCFGNGNGNDTKGCVSAPPSGQLTTTMDQDNGAITGWAQIIGLDQDGWIKIGRGDFVSGGNGEMCYDCQPKCAVWNHTYIDGEGNPITEVRTLVGGDTFLPGDECTEYSQDQFDSCKTCFTETVFDGPQPPSAVEPVIGGSGFVCTNCNFCQKVDGVGGNSRVVCNPDSGGFCNTCNLYGVNRNSADGSLLGWGWNGDSVKEIGAGWLHFNTEYGSSYIVFPWLQTVYGSIYTPNVIRQKAGVGGANATYCLFANDVNVNIKTQSCEGIANGLVQNVNVGFPAKTGGQEIYRNALGKIDINGLLIKTNGGKNKYGNAVIDLPTGEWSGPAGGFLNGAVYQSSGDLIIGSAGIVFNNINDSQTGIGNGIIIVNGNLFINGEISYGSGNPNRLSKLASVAWIVKGDVIIDPNVKDAAGAFIVLGNGGVCSRVAGSDVYYPNYESNRCGVFFSGSSDQSLTVYGLIIAKAFDFRRTFTAVSQGSERVIYDGRLIANPPKGLSGFLEGLPVVRDFAY